MEANRKSKINELLEQNFQVLNLMRRLGMSDCVGDCSLEDACNGNDICPESFILLYYACTDTSFQPSEKQLREARIKDIIRYLHNSHEYYQNTALAALSNSLAKLIEPCSDKLKTVIRRFFNDYEEELRKHFEHEEGHVISYIDSLLEGHPEEDHDIDHIDDCHDSISEKISDLKSLVLNSLPKGFDGETRLQTLYQISELQFDLDRHSFVEDNILVPMVRIQENILFGEDEELVEEEEKETLSEREKEILVGVATGMLNKEIADKYNISIHTVITHRKNITRKTGVKSIAGLTVYALLNGLIDINSIE